MNEQRFVVTDHVWQRLEPYLPEKVGDAEATAKDTPVHGSRFLARRPDDQNRCLSRPFGILVRFLLLPGQAHDMKGTASLIRDVSFGAVMVDKASAVIPPKTNRKQQRDDDADAYKWCHLVEHYFAKIREFRGIATR